MGEKDMLEVSVREFIDSTAAKTPTPGGGSVAGVVGALGTALGEMAMNFTRGKKKYAEHEELYAQVAPRLAKARSMFCDLVSDDMEAFGLYQEAQRMEDGADKDKAMEVATAAAINVPREMAKLTLAVMADLHALADKCNRFLISDLVASAALGVAVLKLCDYNVRINTPYLPDKQAAEEIRASSRGDIDRAAGYLKDIEQAAENVFTPKKG